MKESRHADDVSTNYLHSAAGDVALEQVDVTRHVTKCKLNSLGGHDIILQVRVSIYTIGGEGVVQARHQSGAAGHVLLHRVRTPARRVVLHQPLCCLPAVQRNIVQQII